MAIQDGAKKEKLSVIDDLGYPTSLVGLILSDIAYPFAVEAMQEVNRAIAESKFYPLVYTMDDVRKSGALTQTRASGGGMGGALSRQPVKHASKSQAPNRMLIRWQRSG